MDETKEELETAILQAKKHCIAIQQQVWDHEKRDLRPEEELYVRRYIYAVTVARKTRFFNGFHPSDVPRSKSLTRIYMEQRYHRSKSSPPSMEKRNRSEPKVSLEDGTDGVTSKIEYTETVEESSIRDLIARDAEECEHLKRKLPSTKKNWEHVKDVRMQMSNAVAQKGAMLRIGEHLYGFDGIRDLSFKAAADADRFFGREPNSDLLYQTPYHFLNDYIEEYGSRFFKSSLSRSAYDLSEWRRRNSEPSPIAPSLSHSELFHKSSHADEDVGVRYDPYHPQQQLLHGSFETKTVNNIAHPSQIHNGAHIPDAAREWEKPSTFPEQLPHSPRLSTTMSSSASHLVHEDSYHSLHQSGSEPLLEIRHRPFHSLDLGTAMYQNSALFECNHHLVGDFVSSSAEGSTTLLCDADVQPFAPRLQSEGSIRSMTSSKHSALDQLSVGNESPRLQTPISSYSDAYDHSYADDSYNDKTHHVISENLGTHFVRHDHSFGGRCSDRELSTVNVPLGAGSGERTMETLSKTIYIGSTEGDELSDSETLRRQASFGSRSDSEATVVPNEIEILRPVKELEELHLSDHVQNVPGQHFWDWENVRQSSNEEAEALLRDVHSTHQALKEQIELYDKNARHSPKELLYDIVADDPDHIYDAVADTLHHAHGALVLSEPVKRPLAISPPFLDDGSTEEASSHPEVLGHSDAEHSEHHNLYHDDEHIYEEIGPPAPAVRRIGDGVEAQEAVVQEHEYAVPPRSGRVKSQAPVPPVPERDYAEKTVYGDVNSNLEIAKTTDGDTTKKIDDLKEVVYAKMVHIDYPDDEDTIFAGSLNRKLEKEHQIIRKMDDKPVPSEFSATEKLTCQTETYETAKNIPSPTFQRLQHLYTPEDVARVKQPPLSPSGNREFDMNKYEDVPMKDADKSEFDKEAVLATVAIRRMSRTNQWSEDDERRLGSREFERGPLSPLSPRLSPRSHSSPAEKTSVGLRSPSAQRSRSSERQEVVHRHAYNERSFGKQEIRHLQKSTDKGRSTVFDEFTFEGIHPRSNTGEFLLKKGTPLFSKASGGVEVLKRYPEIQETAVPTVGQGVEVLHHYPDVEVKSKKDRSKPVLIGEEAVTFPIPTMEHIPASPSTPTFRKGFVHEMAKKFEQGTSEESGKKSSHANVATVRPTERQWQEQAARFGNGPTKRPTPTPPLRESTSASKVSVKETVRSLERAALQQDSPEVVELSYVKADSSRGRRPASMSKVSETVRVLEQATSHPPNDDVVELSYEMKEPKRQRMVSIGTPESINLDEIDLPRWSPNRSVGAGASSSGKRDNTQSVDPCSVVSHPVVEHHSDQPPSSPIHDRAPETTSAPEEAEQTEQKPVALQRNGSGRRSWPVKTYEYVNFSRQKLKMPDIESFVHNGNLPNPERIAGEENAVLRDWNPRALVRALYEVSYEPRVETKRNRFVSMEGHVDVPSDETSSVAELERHWKQLYMRTKEGRLQIFVSHCADEAPAEEIVLSGVDVDANREERTLTIHGGRDHIRMTLRVQSNVFDKWRHSLLSHAASSQIDAYVKPIPKTFQHLTERVVVLEIGSCSIRGGVLTTEPSLPQSFFPSIAVRTDDGRIVVGEDAYAPEIRHHGEFVRPIQALDPNVERYTIDREVVKECIKKVIKDININPAQYKVLLSIPQNIPIALIGELLTLVLKEIGFQGAAITRQPSLILYAYDVTTGVVVDIGDRLNIVPVIDGYVVESAICSIPYGATQVREALRTTLCSNNKGLYSFQSPIEKLILRYVLEQTSYVPDDYAQEEKTSKEVNISLDRFDPLPGMPTKFSIDNSRFLCTEGLFRPKKWGLDTKGLHQLVHEAVQMSPIDSRRTLYRNIYLAGGASLMPGLAEKLEQELALIVPNSIHTQVHISPWRYNAAYLGAQIVASASTFSDSCVSLENLPTFLSNLQSSCF